MTLLVARNAAYFLLSRYALSSPFFLLLVHLTSTIGAPPHIY